MHRRRTLAWAWAAGLFEGEGTITITDRRLRLALKMTDEDVVRRFHGVAGGTVYGPYAPGPQADGCERKTVWVWNSDRADPTDILNHLLPWLCARRAARAREFLEWSTPRLFDVPTRNEEVFR